MKDLCVRCGHCKEEHEVARESISDVDFVAQYGRCVQADIKAKCECDAYYCFIEAWKDDDQSKASSLLAVIYECTYRNGDVFAREVKGKFIEKDFLQKILGEKQEVVN